MTRPTTPTFASTPSTCPVRSAPMTTLTRPFADASGFGAWTAQSGVQTVLTQTDALPSATQDFYHANEGVTLSVAIGGTSAVSKDVLSTLESDFGQDTRRVNDLQADNRAGTAVAINDARDLDPADLDGIVFVDGYADWFFIDAYSLAGPGRNQRLRGPADQRIGPSPGDDGLPGHRRAERPGRDRHAQRRRRRRLEAATGTTLTTQTVGNGADVTPTFIDAPVLVRRHRDGRPERPDPALHLRRAGQQEDPTGTMLPRLHLRPDRAERRLRWLQHRRWRPHAQQQPQHGVHRRVGRPDRARR